MEYLIRIAYHAIRMIGDPIVQMQGDRTNLARAVKPQVSRRHSGSGLAQTSVNWMPRPRLKTFAIHPGNRLESLKGDRVGQMSIRINDQWRICFRWSKGDADDVEIVDYHS